MAVCQNVAARLDHALPGRSQFGGNVRSLRSILRCARPGSRLKWPRTWLLRAENHGRGSLAAVRAGAGNQCYENKYMGVFGAQQSMVACVAMMLPAR